MKEKFEIDIEYAKELYDNGTSMRKIAKILECSLTKVQKELNSYNFNLNNPYKEVDGKNLIAICKKTGKEFFDYDNRSGSITTHLLELFPDLEIPSHYKRKDILYKTFKYWYHNYFNFEYRDIKKTVKCKYCEWETEDINNLSGAYMNHMINTHDIDIDKYLNEYPNDKIFFKNYVRKIERNEFLDDKDNHVECKICGERLKKITQSHLDNHNITLFEYKKKYKLYNPKDYISKTSHDIILVNRKENFFPKKIHKRSKGENEIIKFLNFHNIKTIPNERNLLDGFELDIYLPEYKIGIEFNGVYFHSEYTGKKDIEYHKSKTNILESKGIKLIHIFDVNYEKCTKKINRMLLDFIGINLIKINTDNNIVNYIDENKKNEFIRNNTINVIDKSEYCISTIINEKIFSILCFDYIENKIKINNYICKIGYRIEDDHILMFESIKTKFKFDQIIGYYNKLWNDFDGNFFEKLGFKKNKNIDPDFYYIKYNGIDKNMLINKNFYTKEYLKERFKDIYSDILSVDELFNKAGYDKIWDSGSIEYLLYSENDNNIYKLNLNKPINRKNTINPPKYKEIINNKNKKPSKKVVLLDCNYNFIRIYNSIKDCSNHMGYTFHQVYERLRGKYKNNLPHKFVYLKDYNGIYDLKKDLYKIS